MSAHVCAPEYVAEGEVVCFGCGAAYLFHGVYNAEELAACRAVIAARASDRSLVGAQPEDLSKNLGSALRQRAPETRERGNA